MVVETARAASKEGAMRGPIRVGVIGSGSVAQKYIPHMQRMNIPRQRVDITVVCDPDERQWDDARQRYGLDTFTADYREVLADPDDRPRAGADLDAATWRDRAGRARGRQARAGRETDGDDTAGGRGAGRARGAESRAISSARRTSSSARPIRRSGSACSRAPSARSSARAASTAGLVRAGVNGSIDPAAGRCSISASTT